MAGRRITIEFLGADRSLSKTADKVNGSVGSLGEKLKKFGKVAAVGFGAAGVAALKLGGDSIKAASDAQQSLGATETVFGKYADAVTRNSDRASKAVGLSANAYRENANLIGSLFKNQGVESDKLAGKTDKMIKLGADLAATFGGTTKESVEALGSAFKGEFDPLERYGVSLKQSTINAELAKRGQDKLTGAAAVQAKQMVTTDLIMRQSKDSLGAFGRESDTLAHRQQVLGAQFDNLKSTIGQRLLPIATKLTGWASDFVEGMQSSEGAGGRFKAIIAAIGDVIRPVGTFIGTQLVPFLRDLVKRFQDASGGTSGLKKTLNDLAPAVRVVKAVLGVLWEGFKYAAKTLIPVLVRNFQLTAKVIGTLGQAATWLWNKAFAPTLRFIVKGVAGLMNAWGAMLRALGKLPNFDWAKNAGNAMGRAADQASALGRNIRAIPANKKVNVTTTYTAKNNDSRRGPAGVTSYIPHRASGGHVQAGGLYEVNERGTEMFQPYRSGRIVNSRQTAKAAGGGGDIYLTVNGALDPNAVAKQVQTVLLKLKRQNGGQALGLT